VGRSSDWSRYPGDGGNSIGASAAVFIGFVAAGCAYIILAKLRGIGQLYVTFVPIATMLGYALLITLARRLRLRDDQSGDNLYYMGFLFTLTSLGVSLYQFSATRAAEEIVQNFGIAIGSTIAGIGLRVIFNQMRRDPVEVERTMRLELAEAARRVRRELDSTVVEFGYFRRSAEQSAADSFRLMTERFDELLAKLFAKLDEISKSVAMPVETAAQRSGAAIDAVSETIGTRVSASAVQLSAETEKLVAHVATITTALDATTARLNTIQSPGSAIEAQLESLSRLLAQTIELMIAHSENQSKAVTEALSVGNAAAASSDALVATLRRELEAAGATNRTSLDAAVAMIRATADVLNEIKANSRDYVEALGMMLDRTDATMRKFTEVVAHSNAEGVAWSDRLAQALPAIEAKVQELAVAAERIAWIVEDAQHLQSRPEVVD
jgi:hypothetical protein